MAGEEGFGSPVDLIPGYETDISAVGRNRSAMSPDDGMDWTEVHELGDEEAEDLCAEHGS
jgi:hypothetical protein